MVKQRNRPGRGRSPTASPPPWSTVDPPTPATSTGSGSHRRVLWLSGEVPAPADAGLLVYSGGLSAALAGAGVEVVGLGLERAPVAVPPASAPEPAPGQGVDWRPVAGRRRAAAASLGSRLPKMAWTLATGPYRRALTAALGDGPWDAVVIDHLQMGWAAGVVLRHRPSLPFVYVAHNHEATARRAAARRHARHPVRGAALALDAAKAAALERRLTAEAALLTAITPADAERFRRRRSGPSLVLAPGYTSDRIAVVPAASRRPRRVALVANLNWHVKQDNLRALLAVADPIFAAAGVELAVIGPAPESFVVDVARALRATTFTGPVPSIPDALATARIGVISEPVGGGFKLKALDYVFGGVPMAVTAGSMEGLPLEPGHHYLEFRDEAALARGVVEAIDQIGLLDDLAGRALDRCRPAFSWAERGGRLAAALTGLRASC